MNAIQTFLENHKKPIFAITTSILLSYLAFGNRKTQQKPNLLSVSLNQLIKDSTTQNITKIIITACPSSKGNFRRELINQIKKKLTQENIKVLINCSPQKLLIAGTECFLQSMQRNDGQYIEYYYNLLRNQYLIEDTISKIELINEQSHKIVMICDNSPIDIKLLNESDNLWDQFLQKYDLSLKNILNSYALVFHIIQEDSVAEEDKRIQEAWKGSGYFAVKADDRHSLNNCQDIYQKISQYFAVKQSEKQSGQQK